ncbi:MAG: oligosaccharide flippase family protein, partial [Candidatus Onthovivens sp.]|nr:oligosaccharide flippase family protein [Candidatus Onthovivens sp.]
MEIKSKTIKDILKVTFSNACILLSGILVGFLLPKIIDQVDYGYYKTFTLYIAYIGLFHFGIIDGIYLKYGDKDYNELDKEKFRFYTRFLLILEGAISLLFIIISLFAIQEKEMKFIFVMVSLTLFSTNITSYFQYISQITRRFKELTLRNIVQSILISLAIISLFISYKYFRLVINFEIYTIIYVIILFLLMVWYIFAYRDITFGKASKGLYKDILYFLKIGFPLLIANLAINLIFMIDRQFVNILYDKVTYATYAFSYNMLSLITTLINSIALVIYP